MRILDITEKLNFKEKPKLKIKGIELTVNNEAVAILSIIPKVDKPKFEDFDIIAKTLFDEENLAKLETLHLDINDYMKVLISAISLVTNSDSDDAGETVTPDTI